MNKAAKEKRRKRACLSLYLFFIEEPAARACRVYINRKDEFYKN